jgi:hypothetical protein
MTAPNIQKRIAVSFFLLLVLINGNAQNEAMNAIAKIYNAYNSNTIIRFNGNMKMFAKSEPAKIIEKMRSSYIIKDKNFICIIGPVEMLLNDNYYVSVDNSEKIIMIGRKKDLAAAARMPVLNIDQFKKQITDKKIQAVAGKNGTTAVLQLTDEKGASGYNSYNIEYDEVKGYMKKVVLETDAYNNENDKTLVLEINYTQPEPVENTKDFFSEKTFFSIVNNKIQLTPDYKNYQIINQL